ncbi:uncharacterized protein LOC124810196 [Hydra vulgaris]|uniref:uncharacterized protein LOC124810196 n=1 Tax=Hydra vulgaris TaxID=6087 RepID=UPI001F5E5FB3|nr:uncharacterized protein LOC124810196 [Hydra vulgaris]
MGIQAVKSHAAGKKHQSATKPVSCFFINGKELHAEPFGSEEKISTFSTKKQSIIVSLIKSSLSTNAEIIWALKSTMGCYSNNSCANLNDTFKKMFPDSKIAEDFTMNTSKVSYIVNHGLAPYFKTLLKEEITKSDCYIVFFYESLNDITQTCQMDLLVRYWDDNDKFKYRTSAFLGHSAASDLLTHINENVSRFDSSKMYQVFMDGPSTNLKFLDDLNKRRMDNEMSQLIVAFCM